MQSLADQYRPRTWADVVGQDKAIAKLRIVARRGWGGRAYWLSGSSGTGKSTIAKLIAAELADDWCIEECVGRQLTAGKVEALRRSLTVKGIGCGGRVVIVDEAHGMNKPTIECLLAAFDPGPIPAHAAWIFTTTTEGEQRLFDDYDDTAKLLSRCVMVNLARRGLSEPFAERLHAIASVENLNGQPVEAYVKLLRSQAVSNNMRAALMAIEAGAMLVD